MIYFIAFTPFSHYGPSLVFTYADASLFALPPLQNYAFRRSKLRQPLGNADG
jgi:hypothetical protein